MAVYLGEYGCIELARAAGSAVDVTLEDGDVSVEKRRFSPKEDLLGVFITGDQVDIERIDGEDLILVNGHNFNDWRGFLYIDAIGGIRLYDSFNDAVRGKLEDALVLDAHSETQYLRIKTRNDSYTPLASVRNFEFTTNREAIDTTCLGKEFVERYEAGLISGQGTIDCIWQANIGLCSDGGIVQGAVEFPVYLAQLCIRMQEGADFFGRFFIYKAPDPEVNNVWYEAECIVTSVSTTVGVAQVIESTIQFVTTGKFRLLTGTPPYYLLQEDGFGLVLMESGDRIIINSPE